MESSLCAHVCVWFFFFPYPLIRHPLNISRMLEKEEFEVHILILSITTWRIEMYLVILQMTRMWPSGLIKTFLTKGSETLVESITQALAPHLLILPCSTHKGWSRERASPSLCLFLLVSSPLNSFPPRKTRWLWDFTTRFGRACSALAKLSLASETVA